jgi:hypothetical protein
MTGARNAAKTMLTLKQVNLRKTNYQNLAHAAVKGNQAAKNELARRLRNAVARSAASR